MFMMFCDHCLGCGSVNIGEYASLMPRVCVGGWGLGGGGQG